MAKDWFEALDEKDVAANARARDTDQESTATDNDGLAECANTEDDFGERVAEKQPRWNFEGKSMWAIAGVVALGAVLVPVLGKGIESMVSAESATTTAVAGPAAVVTDSPEDADNADAALALSEKAEIGPGCTENTDELADEDSVRGAATEFERAYFLRNSEQLLETTAKESPLRKQKWDEILPEAAPDGTKWCAAFAPVKHDDTSVDLDLTMELPGEEAATYKQVVTGQNTEDGWKVVKIDARET